MGGWAGGSRWKKKAKDQAATAAATRAAVDSAKRHAPHHTVVPSPIGATDYSVLPMETSPTTGGIGAAYSAKQQAAQAALFNATDDQVIEYIKTYYSPGQVHLLEVPELRQAILKTAREGMTPEQAMVEIEKTSWWQERSESMAKYDLLAITNPMEYQAQVNRRMASLIPEWESYGIDGDVAQAARDALRLGYTDDQIRLMMADALQKESDTHGLDTGSKGQVDAEELLRIARQEFLTPMPRSTAEQWAIKALRTGTDVREGWRQYMASLSSSRFGIDPTSGITPGDLMAPARAAIAQNLELDPDAIDLLDDRYSQVLQVPTDDGGFRPMTQFEAIKWARNQPEFAHTKVASDLSAEVGTGMAKMFGKLA